MNENSSTTLLMNDRVLNYTYDKGFIIIQKYIFIIMLMTIYKCNFLYIYILSLSFLSLNLYAYCLIFQRENM